MNKEINLKVLDLIYNSIKSEGGDGDAIWLCKHTPLKEIYDLIEWYNTIHKTSWKAEFRNENLILWGEDQEWAEITDAKDTFENAAKWIILQINY
jgi:hypothetical protein